MATTVCLVWLSRFGVDWTAWDQATCMPDDCFCEDVREGTVRQPSNTWSSLAFLLVGLLVLFSAFGEKDNGESRFQAIHAIVFGVATAIIGVGSAFYHASLSFVGMWVDLMGMYLLAGFMLIYNLSRLRTIRPATFVLSYVLLCGMGGVLIVEVTPLRRYIFGALILGALITEWKALKAIGGRIDVRLLQAASLSFTLAFVIWTLDILGTLCCPTCWLQGHAVWHLLGAIAALFLVLYYRSEKQEVT